MILAKLYTDGITADTRKWTPVPFELSKEDVTKRKSTTFPDWLHRFYNADCTDYFGANSLMFDDGTIWDGGNKCRFRSEEHFPKDETIIYMNKILNGEI